MYDATATAQQLGLQYSDYNFLMGLSGILSGFIFLFFVLYITIIVAKG
ncbi:hypothetical protein [Malaciobacter pacificus]|jgi:hypothetical protein|nr:hypothetical protein [Malaciobacter pacificus]